MKSKSGGEVMDGSDLMELVENEKVFSNFVDHKFQELDTDCDGKLSVNELQPAVADIGAALGLPAQGSSPESDHIYREVLDEFTHGKQEKISKIEFKEVLSDILLGMAAGLKRDPEIELPDGSLRDYIIKAFEKLTVVQGMPPATDPWVANNIVEPALKSLCIEPQQPVSQETFLVEFKRAIENVVQHLKEQPAIVAHSQNTFDGSGIKRLLSNKFELDKTLDSALESVPKDHHGKISKAYMRLALDVLAPSAGLPPFGAVDQMDGIMIEALKMFNADDGKLVKKDEFKKLLTEVLGCIMLQLQGNPISVFVNSVVHEPLASSSTLLQTSSP
ncbi:Calcium-binding EF-hand family protein [Abeliophyllum distichum]|uniref:Calcium-binding EF-hand family protein n=1 Tax=Abeliophyllum distichum TaxID=126358 RepID=A0ABD1TID1_9LAMI